MLLRSLSRLSLVTSRHSILLSQTVNKLRPQLASQCEQISFVRFKYITSGIQGRRNSKAKPQKYESNDEEDLYEEENDEGILSRLDNEYNALASEALGNVKNIQHEENVLIIQPYIKWGPKKSPISPDIKLQEAEDLIRSLDTWNIAQSIKVPLLSFGKRSFFGGGKIDELRKLAKGYGHTKKISCVFVSVSRLTQEQRRNLEWVFELPVMDRFSVVIQILRAHATSREAKLQISLAELPYIWHHLGSEDTARTRSKLTDAQRVMLRQRERRIKIDLERIRTHRQMARRRRSNKEYPVVAIVGYTNAGKTSLIKALTNQEKIEPKNKLFATLDVTAHEGRLPCNLKVLYIDTIGFMSDIPTELLECFITTLEDALMADLIIHVQDVAHINVIDQRSHVESTLQNLMFESEVEKNNLLQNIINVGNKCDLVSNIGKKAEKFDDLSDVNETAEPMHFVSCVKANGIEELKEAIEKNILKVTKRKKMIIRVPQKGEELPWLYRNTAVTHTEIDDRNSEYIKVHLLITDLGLTQFKNEFLTKRMK